LAIKINLVTINYKTQYYNLVKDLNIGYCLTDFQKNQKITMENKKASD